MYIRSIENITIALLPVGHFQQLINVNRSWLILMQSCGRSAEFERILFKLSKIHRTSLTFIVSLTEVFKREQENLYSQISLFQSAEYVKTTSK